MKMIQMDLLIQQMRMISLVNNKNQTLYGLQK
jgi:hypothetical protein